ELHVGRQRAGELRIADVAGDHLDAVAAARVLQPAPAVERVVLRQRPHPRARLDQHLGEVRADESVGAGDEDAFVADAAHATARITRATLSNSSATWLSLMISGGVRANVSPMPRTITPSSWKAFCTASKPRRPTASGLEARSMPAVMPEV